MAEAGSVVTEEKSEVESSKVIAAPEVLSLESKIIRQIEYYFGDANMPRDKFLQEQISKDDGWVPIDVLLTFKRLAAISESKAMIVAAMEKSEEGLVEMSKDKTCFRRHLERPLPELNEEHRKEVMSRTAYVKGLPATDTTMEDLIKLFEPFERVTHIFMRKYMDKATKTYLFKGSVFITFATVAMCEKFLAKDSLKYNGIELERKKQAEYLEGKKEERSKRDDKKKNKQVDKIVVPEFKLPTGAVMYMENISETVTREIIKERIADLGYEVAYVDFNKGDKVGYARLTKENAAKEMFEKLESPKIMLGECEVDIRLLQGEEEETFLANAIKLMKARRSNNKNRNGGGRNKFQKNNRKRQAVGSDEDEVSAKRK